MAIKQQPEAPSVEEAKAQLSAAQQRYAEAWEGSDPDDIGGAAEEMLFARDALIRAVERRQQQEIERLREESAAHRPQELRPTQDVGDIPQDVQRELMRAATANGSISFYYLCDIYRKGSAAHRAEVERLKAEIDFQKTRANENEAEVERLKLQLEVTEQQQQEKR